MIRQHVLVLAILQLWTHINGQSSPYRYAHCDFASIPPIEAITGQVLTGDLDFRQTLSGPLEVKLVVSGFNTVDQYRSHSTKIHQYGDVTGPSCENSGVHYNPLNVRHGDRTDDIFDKHMGDWGNYVEDSNGAFQDRFVDEYLSLDGEFSVVGRLFSIGLQSDDLGRVESNEQSAIDGNAGLINLGCCIIGHADGRAWLDD